MLCMAALVGLPALVGLASIGDDKRWMKFDKLLNWSSSISSLCLSIKINGN